MAGNVARALLRRVHRAIGLCALSSLAAAQPMVEIGLVAPLDEPRGYCLDIVGSPARARTDRPLHAHTCYGYRGGVTLDQGLDPQALPSGRLRFVHFDLCMSAAHAHAGAPLLLAPCAARGEQRFTLSAEGHIRPEAASGLCLTVADGEGLAGGGGQPIHLRRALTLEPCTPSAHARQRWRQR